MVVEKEKIFDVHERKLETMLLSSIAFLLESFVWFKFFEGDFSLATAFISHLLISGACAATIPLYTSLRADVRIVWLLTTAVTFLGPFGGLIAFLIIPGAFIYKWVAPTSKELLDEILPPVLEKDSKKITERIEYNLDSYDPARVPLAFQDVMAFGSNQQKQVAIQRMLKNFRPEFTTALMHAINDENRGVRILAATAIVRLDKQFNDIFQTLQEEIRIDPNNPEVCLKFARHCDGQSRLKFIDPIRVRKLRQLSISTYEHYLQLVKGNEKVLVTMARLYCLENRPQDAIALLEPLVEGHKRITDDVAQWFMTALFYSKEYGRLREFSRRDIVITGESIYHDEIVDSCLMWREGNSSVYTIKEFV